MYVLNIDQETNRILSACVVLPDINYDGMPIVDTLPEGDVSDYLYVDGEFVYDPLPKPEQPAPDDYETRIAALEAELKAAKILLGVA